MSDIYTQKQIMSAVCAVSGITLEELHGTSRKAPLTHARALCCWFMRFHTAEWLRSWPNIANALRYGSHHAAMYHVEAIGARVAARHEPTLRQIGVIRLVLESPDGIPCMPVPNQS